MTKLAYNPGISPDGKTSSGDGDVLLLFSVSHHSAPVDVREKLAFGDEERTALLADLTDFATEAVGITTCNRTELYLIVEYQNERVPNRLLQTVAHHAGIAASDLARVSRFESDEQAARHLFRVASGLDSVILGEPQILGQVRDAMIEAHKHATSGPILERLFQRALAAGKRARSQTKISRGAGSISHAAVKLARDTVGDLSSKRALTVGIGEMGCLVARNLAAHGVGEMAICNRTLARAEEAARQFGGDVIPWERLDDAVRSSDIVITATASDGYLLTREHLVRPNGHNGLSDVLVIDISVPRNVDPAVDDLPHVRRYDIDALQAVRTRGMRDRKNEIPRVETIIAEETEIFREWYRGRQLAPVIRDLYGQAMSIQERELEKALRRLGHLSERDQEIVRALAHGITRKILHNPVTRLKASDDPDTQASFIGELFDLKD
jgi:glutamyl-tRNA reductase